MNDCIAFKIERELTFRIGNTETKGTVSVGELTYEADQHRWACYWSLSHLHHGVSRVYGKDPMEAVLNTIDFLSAFIRGSEEDGYAVWWQQEGDHGGFTLPMLEARRDKHGD